MNLLEVTKLVKTYSGRTVVNDVSFLLHQREVVGLLGRNGAGKTTTFRMILGMVEPDSGAVAFDATDITFMPMYKRARLGIGYLSQERSDFRRLTVYQNLLAILETLPISRAERFKRADGLLEHYGLTKQKAQKAETLSGGERRKLEIARALVTNPKLILLDEPFSGVDPIAVEDLQKEVKRLKEEFGKSVLITDHNVAQTLRVCDRALIISDGQVFKEGTPREIINDASVRSTYLGNTFRGDEFDDVHDDAATGDKLLRVAKSAIAAGSTDNARVKLATVISKHPKTPAAAEARQLLEQIKKRD
jgi:lipopolysaccharide export system ATP-binding protein